MVVVHICKNVTEARRLASEKKVALVGKMAQREQAFSAGKFIERVQSDSN